MKKIGITALLLIVVLAIVSGCGASGIQSPIVFDTVEEQIAKKCGAFPAPTEVTVNGSTYNCSTAGNTTDATPADNAPDDGTGLQESNNDGCPYHTSADWQAVSGQPLVPDSGEACMGSYNSKGQSAVNMSCPDGFVCTVHESDGIHLRLGPGNFTSTDFTVRKLSEYPEGLCGIMNGELRQATFVGYTLIVDDAINGQCQ